MKYLFSIVLFLFCTVCYAEDLQVNKSRSLKLSDSHHFINLSKDIGLPVSIVAVDHSKLVVASYLNLWLVHIDTGEVQEILKPLQLSNWYPTGVTYDNISKELFVANYLGKDLLVFKFNNKNGFHFIRRISSNEIVGPENVSISKNGKYIALADFDANSIVLINRSNSKVIWAKTLGRAHGVQFSKDDSYIYATGLSPPQVVKLDIYGHQLFQVGFEGWGNNGYLWPTAVEIDDNNVYIADAHSGNIKKLATDILQIDSIGENGPKFTQFNMPYGIYKADAENFYVTDTFKSRIVKLNYNTRTIQTVYNSPSRENANVSISELKTELQTVNDMDFDGDGLFDSYVGRFNKARSISGTFGLFEKPRVWFPGFGYNAFVDNSDNVVLSMAGAAPFFSTSLYYWIQAENTKNIHHGLVYGSPQVREWLFDDGGIICPYKLDLDYWLSDQSLKKTTGHEVKFKQIIDNCSIKKLNFANANLIENDPITNYIKHYLNVDEFNFLANFKFVFQSANGVEFLKNVCQSNSGSDVSASANIYLEDMSKMHNINLPEIWATKLLTLYNENSSMVSLKYSCHALHSP